LEIRGLNQIGLQGIKAEEKPKRDQSSLGHKIEEVHICGSEDEEDQGE